MNRSVDVSVSHSSPDLVLSISVTDVSSHMIVERLGAPSTWASLVQAFGYFTLRDFSIRRITYVSPKVNSIRSFSDSAAFLRWASQELPPGDRITPGSLRTTAGPSSSPTETRPGGRSARSFKKKYRRR